MKIQDDKDVAKELISLLKKDTEIIEKAEKTAYTMKLASGEKLLVPEKFSEMALKSDLVEGIYKLGYEKPSLIQAAAIPLIGKGNNIAIQSMSGTGKTLSFVVPVLNYIRSNQKVQAIIVTPTKDLNNQIGDLVNALGLYLKISCYNATKENRILDNDVHSEVVVGSPGSLLNLMRDQIIDSEQVKIIVFDEADALLTSFDSHIKRLINKTPKAQRIFFSATYTDAIKRKINNFCGPVKELYEENAKPEEIKLYHFECKRQDKISILLELYEYLSIGQMIVFTNSRKMAEKLKVEFESDKHKVSIVHGEMDIKDRINSVDDFRSAKTKILISTDVFSRGMDIPQVNLIVNYDMPVYQNTINTETYIHRVGRSGRFGRTGFVIDFVCDKKDYDALVEFQRILRFPSKKFSIEALRDAYAETD